MTYGPAVLVLNGLTATREQWLAARRTGIGASEIAAVLGISPYESPFSLYWRKKLGTDTPENEQMEWGRRHEWAIAKKFAENHAEFYIENPNDTIWRHPDHPWMLATPDRLLWTLDGDDADELIGLAQIKTCYSFDDWGEPGTDQIPAYYRAQVQQEMAVMGVDRCYVPVLAGGCHYREYVVDYDPADVELIVKAGAEFMRRLDADDPPDIDGSEATTRTLKQLHPTVVDEAVTIPQDLAAGYRDARARVQIAQLQLVAYENEIRDHLGPARTAVYAGRKVAQRYVYDVTRLDTARLRAEHPDLAAEYTKTSTVDALRMIKETE
ncbi:MAG: YqaJ viral recombinase family protein [Actinomycetota bacterium]|nr:YqaJ viral recombinase family protein [Actinomycetota bacterium]